MCLCFELVWCVVLYIIIHILLYLIIIHYYYIISYTIHILLLYTLLLLLYIIHILSYTILSSSLLFLYLPLFLPISHLSIFLLYLSSFHSSSHSFYTCRYLDILIYILLFLPNHKILTFILYLSVLGYGYLCSSHLFPSSPPIYHSFPIIRFSHSFYTCREFHTVIYILLQSSQSSSPNPSQTRYPSLKGIHIYL